MAGDCAHFGFMGVSNEEIDFMEMKGEKPSIFMSMSIVLMIVTVLRQGMVWSKKMGCMD